MHKRAWGAIPGQASRAGRCPPAGNMEVCRLPGAVQGSDRIQRRPVLSTQGSPKR